MSLHVHYAQFAHLFLLLLLCTFCGDSSAISIDNDIIGDPDIECLDQEIRVWVKTRKIFAGRIYAKGKSEDPDCSKDNFAKDRTKKPHFDLPLGMCGMKSQRSLDPRGMYYGITLVISFHPLFITKVDQAFHVKCFFEEANRGLTAELGVSMIPTTEVNARHSIMGCSYSIHRSSIVDLDAGRPAGTAIQFAKVGDKVLHQWHCEDPMFGILINNCYVTDGVNKRAQVIDASGCPVDPILITGIRYSADLQRAYAESQVFKFADRPGVWFFCQIQMCMKKERMCDGITPPSCATTTRPPTDERISSGRRGGNGRSRGDGSELSLGDGDGADNAVEEPIGGDRADDFDANSGEQLGPTRISTVADKVPNDYENYVGDSGAGGSSTGRGSQRTRRPPRPSSRQQEQTKPPDGYAPVQSPSAVEYEANEDDSSKSVTVFEPGYSPTDSSSFASNNGRGFSASQTQDISGAGQTYDSVAVHRSKVITEENVSAIDPYQAPSLGRDDGVKTRPQEDSKKSKSQQTSVDFETADDLRPNSSLANGAPSPPVGSAGPRTTIAGPPSSIATTTKPTSTKKDYIEYDENDSQSHGEVNSDDEDITIPPNLVDLLSKLPPDEEINADNLQRMFRDSVADRRALLSGFDALINKMRRNDAQGDEKSSIRKSPLRHQPTPTASTASPFIISFNDGAKSLPIGPMRRLPTSRLVPGTKIGTQQVSWDSAPDQQQNRLARDSPLPFAPGNSVYSSTNSSKTNPEESNNNTLRPTTTSSTIAKHTFTPKVARSAGTVDFARGGHASVELPKRPQSSSSSLASAPHHLLIPSGDDLMGGGGPNSPPMIAGQLLIYDLDETPPDEESRLSESAVRVSGGECALTRQGLFLLASSLSSLIAALVIVVVALLFKTRNAKNERVADYRRKRSDCPSSATLTPLSLSASSLKCGEAKMDEEWQPGAARIGPSTTNIAKTFETFSVELPSRPSLLNSSSNTREYFAKLQ